jgi:protoporphyrinogen oxidase
VRVFERQTGVGGMARTLRLGEYRFDLGPHRFYTRDQRVLKMIKELLGKELVMHERISRVRLNGRFLDYPPNVANLVRSMEPSTSLRCLLDYFSAFLSRRGFQAEEADFQNWVINRFGRHLYDIYFGPYTQKVWGRPPELLSAELARRRITVPSLGDVLLRLMFSSHRDQGPYVTHFWYPERGVGRIAERLREDIVDHNGEVLLGQEVEKVRLEGKRVVGVEVNDESGVRFVPCQWVLSTLPLPQLIAHLDPPQDKLSAQLGKITYRALVFVFVTLNSSQIGTDHWLYFPEGSFIFNRVSEPLTFSPTHAPAGKTSLCVEITCDEGDELWVLPEGVLYERVIRDLVRARLIHSDQVEEVHSYRFPWGYPIYTVGYGRHIEQLTKFVDEVDNLVTFGRQGGFDYSNMSEAIASGLRTADMISTSLSKGEAMKAKVEVV